MDVPRPVQVTSIRASLRIKALEALIKKYAKHVGDCEGVSFLENRYRDSTWTDAEWTDIRNIAEETDS